MARLMQLRLAIGRWLLRPEYERIRRHYQQAERENYRNLKRAEGEHCAYIVIGADYVGHGWPHRGGAWEKGV